LPQNQSILASNWHIQEKDHNADGRTIINHIVSLLSFGSYLYWKKTDQGLMVSDAIHTFIRDLTKVTQVTFIAC
jgi:hypothetical protein